MWSEVSKHIPPKPSLPTSTYHQVESLGDHYNYGVLSCCLIPNNRVRTGWSETHNPPYLMVNYHLFMSKFWLAYQYGSPIDGCTLTMMVDESRNRGWSMIATGWMIRGVHISWWVVTVTVIDLCWLIVVNVIGSCQWYINQLRIHSRNNHKSIVATVAHKISNIKQQ